MVFVSLLLFLLAYAVKIVGDLQMLKNVSIYTQAIISVSLIIVPTILIALYVIPINYLLLKIFGLQQSHQEMLNDDFDV
jgi:hypothetical protein